VRISYLEFSICSTGSIVCRNGKETKITMRILLACEYSGVGREAFRAMGHEVLSCDLLAADDGSPYHYQGDVRDVLYDGWDMLVAHPECTRLTNAGVRWLRVPPPGVLQVAA
jgi:hypothetical protein